MEKFLDPDSVTLPFSFSGFCPYDDCASLLITFHVAAKSGFSRLYCPDCGRKIRLLEDAVTLIAYRLRSYETQDGGKATVKTEGTSIVWLERLPGATYEHTYTFDSEVADTLVFMFQHGSTFSYQKSNTRLPGLVMFQHGSPSSYQKSNTKLPGLARYCDRLTSEDCQALFKLLMSAIEEVKHPAAVRRMSRRETSV